MYMFEIALDSFVVPRFREVRGKRSCVQQGLWSLAIRLSKATATFPAACFLFFFFSFSFSFFLFSFFSLFRVSSKLFSLRLLGRIDGLLAIRGTDSNSKNCRKFCPFVSRLPIYYGKWTFVVEEDQTFIVRKRKT